MTDAHPPEIVTAEFERDIARRLQEYFDNPPQRLARYMADAHQFEALPLGVDFYIDYLLRPAGELVKINFSDDPRKVEFTNDRKELLTSLVWAAKFDSTFRDLLPGRPDSAIDCDACKTVGRIMSGHLICPFCCGVGWIAT